MADRDVIVVGAGAAGVGAALELKERGLDCIVLEAADRIGGRAWTDTESLPLPWDRGCHWLHCADVNPLVAWADRLGARYDTASWEDAFTMWRAGDWVSRDEALDARETLLDAFDAVYAAGGAGDERAISEVIATTRWDRHVRYILALLASEDPERISCDGYADYDDTERNWPLFTGYGDLIGRMAAGLPIRTGVAVTGISERPGGVRVETAEGALEARAAVVTVSTNVLNAGVIAFGPGPARELLDVIAEVPCGAYEKIAFALRRPLLEDASRRFCMVDPGAGYPLDFQVVRDPGPMMIAHLAGDFAREMVAAGPAAMVDLATERLVMAFGADARGEILGAATTGWVSDPLVRGAYSYAVPGAGAKRRAMIGADTGRIAFAGEAFSLKWQATAHGAYQSGRDVAARVAGHVTAGAA